VILAEDDLVTIWVTLKLACLSTLLLLLAGAPIAWWLARTRSRFKVVIEALVALPLILPPTVLGFYLLLALGPNGPIGALSRALGGHTLAFTFTGLVIGSIVYSLPFVVQPLRDAFLAINDEVLDAAATLRAGPLDRFLTVVLPLAKPGILTASVLGFAHTIGEFGVALMIGGSIPGRTRVVSIAIYDHVESTSHGQAHLLSAILLLFSFLILLFVYTLNHRASVNRP
jgi:molybdate transport system permease protein